MQTSAVSALSNRSAAKVAAVLLTIALLVVVTAQIVNGQFRDGSIVALIGVLFDLPIATFAILCWLRGWSDSPRAMRAGASALSGALMVGAVSFALGFAGPLILTPDANLGPLFGIIVTGPIGFVLGAVGGAAYGLRRSAGERPSGA